jgi:putative hydrolase of the HAD superfamily
MVGFTRSPVAEVDHEMTVAAVLFDLDETLFDRSSSVRAFVHAQFLKTNLGRPIEAKHIATRFLELDNRGRTSKRVVYRTILGELGIEDDAIGDAMFSEYENNSWQFARLFDGADEMLTSVAELGLPVAIVTNGQTHIQLRSLRALNLDRVVDAYLISEQEGCRKPDAEIFLRAAHRLGVQPEQCIFVGDSPEADIFGPRQVGMKTIWFSNGAVWPSSFSWQADATIRSLREASDIIRDWSAISAP